MPRMTRSARPLAVALLVALALAASLAPGAASAGPTPEAQRPPFPFITKVLVGPTGEMPYRQAFTFAFAKKSLNGSSDPADLARMPEINPESIEIGTWLHYHDSMDVDGPTTTLRIYSRHYHDERVFPSPGVYRYTLTETGPQGTAHGLRMSRASYTVTFYVKADTSPEEDKLTVEQDTDDDGGPGAGKVDPKTGVVFVNKIVPGSASFKLRKTVAGDYGDRGRDFDLTLTLAVPSTAAPAPPAGYTGTVDPTTSYTFAPGTPTPFKLRHGQELSFDDLPAGTELTYTEAGAEGYTPSSSTVVGAAGAVTQQAAEGQSFTLDKIALAGGPNSSELTNTYKTVTPTGIAVGILPYVVMVAVPVLAAAGYLAHRRRMARRS